MTRYQKLYAAVLLFGISAYSLIVGVQTWYQDRPLAYGLILGGLAGVACINALILSAEGTRPYHLARRRQLENKALRRALRYYAAGGDDAGVYARVVLERMGRRKRKAVRPVEERRIA